MPLTGNPAQDIQLQTVTIEKLVHGGQGLGVLADGRKVFIWNALPGESLAIRLIKGRRDYAEAITEQIITSSADRIEPLDEAYLSTSPWQIMTFEAENTHKKAILEEAFAREKLQTPNANFIAGKEQWHYRSKMEYSFWADDDGLHLALFRRGSHGKQIVNGSSIARPEIDESANKICALLNKHGIRGSQLKTVVVRCNQVGKTVVAVFVKDQDFPDLKELADICQGVVVCYSNPKSPASVITSQLYTYGDITLVDKIMGVDICYDVHSFFQVNLPIFERAAKRIDYFTQGVGPKVDFYSGVGTIGIPINATVLVESDPHNIAMARKNIDRRDIVVVEAMAETAINYIPSEGSLIVDPPRAGLHGKVIDKILEAKPKRIAYLSCNPSTQARDIKLLESNYKISCLEGYNFFPRTPHIESLCILELA